MSRSLQIAKFDVNRKLNYVQTRSLARRGNTLPMAKAKPRKRPKIKNPDHFLQGWREYRGMGLADLETITGFSQPYLSQIENGKRRPNSDVLKGYHKALRVSVDALLFIKPPASGVIDLSDVATIEAILGDIPEASRPQAISTLRSFVQTE